MSIASELQDKINAKAAIKASIEAKGVTVGDVKLNQYASKVDAIAQDPSIPVGTGQHLVTFYDFDGKVLKRQRVNTGENATAPATPTHEFLTFAEWNNPFTNVQSDIDTGAIYNTTNGKTYLFITLTPVTGLTLTLYFSKSSTSLMTIDWGDGTTSTSTTSGNQNIQHPYATAGDYIITVDNSAGGIFNFGNSTSATRIFNPQNILIKVYFGENITISGQQAFHGCASLKYVSFNDISIGFESFAYCRKLEFVALNNIINSNYAFTDNPSLFKIIFKSTMQTRTCVTTLANAFSLRKIILTENIILIDTAAFTNSSNIEEYILLCNTVPTLSNINAFSGISSICKIYFKDSIVNDVKLATNWVTYANYIYPLSQKPQSDE